MADSGLIIISVIVLMGLLWLAVWVLRKIARREIEVSVNTALLALLVVILLVPLGLNFSAHLIFGKMNHSGTDETTEHSEHPEHPEQSEHSAFETEHH
jgi:beta-lactamase regulating signal transducer with metallopeptidase domain